MLACGWCESRLALPVSAATPRGEELGGADPLAGAWARHVLARRADIADRGGGQAGRADAASA